MTVRSHVMFFDEQMDNSDSKKHTREKTPKSRDAETMAKAVADGSECLLPELSRIVADYASLFVTDYIREEPSEWYCFCFSFGCGGNGDKELATCKGPSRNENGICNGPHRMWRWTGFWAGEVSMPGFLTYFYCSRHACRAVFRFHATSGHIRRSYARPSLSLDEVGGVVSRMSFVLSVQPIESSPSAKVIAQQFKDFESESY